MITWILIKLAHFATRGIIFQKSKIFPLFAKLIKFHISETAILTDAHYAAFERGDDLGKKVAYSPRRDRRCLTSCGRSKICFWIFSISGSVQTTALFDLWPHLEFLWCLDFFRVCCCMFGFLIFFRILGLYKLAMFDFWDCFRISLVFVWSFEFGSFLWVILCVIYAIWDFNVCFFVLYYFSVIFLRVSFGHSTFYLALFF